MGRQGTKRASEQAGSPPPNAPKRSKAGTAQSKVAETSTPRRRQSARHLVVQSDPSDTEHLACAPLLSTTPKKRKSSGTKEKLPESNPLVVITTPKKPTPKNTPASPTTPPSRKVEVEDVTRPPVLWTWDVFGDADSTRYLSSAQNLDEYINSARTFPARLALVVRGLSIDELKQIFRATQPAFLKGADSYDRNRASEQFEWAHDFCEDRLVERLVYYAKTSWLTSPAGEAYTTQWKKA
ncbi:hypothetical protein MMC31_007642, partial [Peltigera leucophlebia]|nr:hypothetical protein [Peltigera leucophlebia]